MIGREGCIGKSCHMISISACLSLNVIWLMFPARCGDFLLWFCRGRVLVGMADAGFVWLSGGWLVGFQLSSGAGMFPLSDCFLSVTGLTLRVRAEEETILLLTL